MPTKKKTKSKVPTSNTPSIHDSGNTGGASGGYGAWADFYTGETDRVNISALQKNLDIAAEEGGWITLADGREIKVTAKNKDNILKKSLSGEFSVSSISRPGSTVGKVMKIAVPALIAIGAGAGLMGYLGGPASATGTVAGGAVGTVPSTGSAIGGVSAATGSTVGGTTGVGALAGADAAAIGAGVTDVLTVTGTAAGGLGAPAGIAGIGAAGAGVGSITQAGSSVAEGLGNVGNPTDIGSITNQPKPGTGLNVAADGAIDLSALPNSNPLNLKSGIDLLDLGGTVGKAAKLAQTANTGKGILDNILDNVLDADVGGLIKGAAGIAAGTINLNYLDKQSDYLKSLITSPDQNPFITKSLDAINARPNVLDSPFYGNAKTLAGRDPNTPIFRQMQESVVNPGSVLGASGPYGALANYYMEAEKRKAASQGMLPGTNASGALNQGAVDQIMKSLATHVAPLYPQTVQSYATAYGAEQDALSNLLRGNVEAFGGEQNAINEDIRTKISGISPYQSSSNTAIAALASLYPQIITERDTQIGGVANLANNLFG